jgi:hypothetical protein
VGGVAGRSEVMTGEEMRRLVVVREDSESAAR